MKDLQFQIYRTADGKSEFIQTASSAKAADSVRRAYDRISSEKHFVSPVIIDRSGVGLEIPKAMTKTAGAR